MSSRITAATAAALVLLAPCVARAQPVSALSGPDTYLQLRVGAYAPQASDLEDLDTGWEVGGRVGARFTRNVSVEAGIAYYRAEGEMGGSSARLSNLPLTAGVRLRAPLELAELSAFAGGGIQVASVSAGAGVLGDVSDTATSFGYELGAEAAFKLSPMMRVGGDVRWTFVEPKFDTGRLDMGGLHVALTLAYEF